MLLGGREKVIFDAGEPGKSNSIVRDREQVIWAGDHKKVNGAGDRGRGSGPETVGRTEVIPEKNKDLLGAFSFHVVYCSPIEELGLRL